MAASGGGAMEGMSAVLEDTFSFEIYRKITSVTSEWDCAYLQRNKKTQHSFAFANMDFTHF